MEVGARKWRSARGLRLLQRPVVIVTAKRELPLLAKVGAAAGAQEIGPGNAAFDRPSAVAVLALVQCAVQDHAAVHVKIAVGLVTLEIADASLRDEHVELRAKRVDLKLVIARPLIARLEEQLEDIVVPGVAVVLADFRDEIVVLQFGEEVQILAVPQQPRARGGARGRRGGAEPEPPEAIDRLRPAPRRVVAAAVDDEGPVSPAALPLRRHRRRRRARRLQADRDQPNQRQAERNPRRARATESETST